jgi:uncharacterized protein YprB with RNaseH-like and TPR domain
MIKFPTGDKYRVIDIETTGLSPVDSRVTCIGWLDKWKDSGVISICETDERKLLQDFFDTFDAWEDDAYLLTKNGKKFDMPFMAYRAGLWDIKMPRILYEIDHYDMQDITYRWVSLEDMSTILGLEGKSGTGKAAIGLWNNGQYDRLMKYCEDDVRLTDKVFRTMRRLHTK